MSQDFPENANSSSAPGPSIVPGHAAVAHLRGPFSDEAVEKFVVSLRESLTAGPPSLGLLFLAPPFQARAREVLELVRLYGRVPLLAGCSSHALVANGHEIEREPGLSLGLFHLPGAELHAFHFAARDADSASGQWASLSGVTPAQSRGWLIFADPFHMHTDQWLRGWNAEYAPKPILGGLAAGSRG